MKSRSHRTALILAAHGARWEQAANALVRAHAGRIERMKRFGEVAVAFHQGTPSFAEVLDQLSATDITVVPMMTSNGYYTEVVLPRELARNRRYAEVEIRLTPPIGTHPLMAKLVMARLSDLMREQRLDPEQTEVLIVGHGAADHPGSRRATEALVEELRTTNNFARVTGAFLDQHPSVTEAYETLKRENTIVVPFLIGLGQHASADIPQLLGMDVPDPAKLPLRQWINDRLVVCDAAVGTYPGIADIVVDIAKP